MIYGSHKAKIICMGYMYWIRKWSVHLGAREYKQIERAGIHE